MSSKPPLSRFIHFLRNGLEQSARLDASKRSWPLIVALLRTRALFEPKGKLADALDALWEIACSLDSDEKLENGIRELVKRCEEGDEVATFTKDLLEPEFEGTGPTSSSREKMDLPKTLPFQSTTPNDDDSDELKLVKVLYTPLDALAHYRCEPGLSRLLTTLVEVADGDQRVPTREELGKLLEAAEKECPSLRMPVSKLDLGSTGEAFAFSFCALFGQQILDPDGLPPLSDEEVEEPDWKELEEELYAGCIDAIEDWAAQGKGPVAAFLLFADPPSSYVQICFDTPENFEEQRQEHREELLASRKAALEKPNTWRHARKLFSKSAYQLHSTGYFSDVEFGLVDFGEGLAEFSRSKACPVAADEDGDGYVEAQIRMLLCRTLDRLVEREAFDKIRWDRGTQVGYEVHEEDPVVLHVLSQ